MLHNLYVLGITLIAVLCGLAFYWRRRAIKAENITNRFEFIKEVVEGSAVQVVTIPDCGKATIKIDKRYGEDNSEIILLRIFKKNGELAFMSNIVPKIDLWPKPSGYFMRFIAPTWKQKNEKFCKP
jgi:hypothetical protein